VSGQDVVSSTSPGSPVGVWTADQVDAAKLASCAAESDVPCPATLMAISCPSLSLCVAGDDAGWLWTSTNPAGGELASWSGSLVDKNSTGPAEGFTGISCPSVSLCVAMETWEPLVFTSIKPAGAPPLTWSGQELNGSSNTGGQLSAIACAPVSQCVIVDQGGDAHVSETPTGPPSTWKTANIDGPVDLLAVSFPPAYLCVAVDADGNVVVGRWSPTPAQVEAQLRKLAVRRSFKAQEAGRLVVSWGGRRRLSANVTKPGVVKVRPSALPATKRRVTASFTPTGMAPITVSFRG
jgi:hypothetical protein